MDWGKYLVGSSALSVLRSFTDNIFRRDDRKSAAQENLEAQKQLKQMEYKHRSEEQKRAHAHAMKLHLEGIRLKSEFEAEAQEERHQHQQELARLDYENKQRLAAQNHANQMEAIGYKADLDRQSQARNHANQMKAIGYKAYLDRQSQARNHANQMEAIGYKAYLDQQAQERGHRFQTQQLILSNELQVIRELLLRQATHENAKEMEEFRLAMAALDRYMRRSEENSPFVDLPENIREAYFREIYSRREQQPLVLVSAFYEDTNPHEANDKGGFLDFNEAIDDALESALSRVVVKRNGHFKRPLRHKDRDLDIIVPAFSDIPTILIRGKVKAKQIVQPIVTVWNLPGCLENSHFNFVLRSFEIPQGNADKGKLGLQAAVAKEVTVIVGMFSDAYHLVVNGKRPNLRCYAFDNPEQLKILAGELGFYYDLICQADPVREGIYRLDQAIMLGECGIVKEASVQTNNAIQLWYSQKPGFPEKIQADELQDVSFLAKLSDGSDRPFLTKLAETYQLIGFEDKAAQVASMIEEQASKLPKYKQIERFKRNTQSAIERFKR